MTTARKANSSDDLTLSRLRIGFSSISHSHVRTCMSDDVISTRLHDVGLGGRSTLGFSLAEVERRTEPVGILTPKANTLSPPASESDGGESSCTPSLRTIAAHADQVSDDAHSHKKGNTTEEQLSSDDAGSTVDIDEEAFVFVAQRKRVGAAAGQLTPVTAVNFAHSARRTAAKLDSNTRCPDENKDDERLDQPDVPTEASYTSDDIVTHQSHSEEDKPENSPVKHDAEEVRLYHLKNPEEQDGKKYFKDLSPGDTIRPHVHNDAQFKNGGGRSKCIDEHVSKDGVQFELLQPALHDGLSIQRKPRLGDLSRPASGDQVTASLSTFASAGWSLVSENGNGQATLAARQDGISGRRRAQTGSSGSSSGSRGFEFNKHALRIEQATAITTQDSVLVQSAKAEEQRREAGIIAHLRSSTDPMSVASEVMKSPTGSFVSSTREQMLWYSSSGAHERLYTGQDDQRETIIKQAPSHSTLVITQREQSQPADRPMSIAPSVGVYSHSSTSPRSVSTFRARDLSYRDYPTNQIYSRTESNRSANDFGSRSYISFDGRSIASATTLSQNRNERKVCKSKKTNLDWDEEDKPLQYRSANKLFGRSRKNSQTILTPEKAARPGTSIGYSSSKPDELSNDSQQIQTNDGVYLPARPSTATAMSYKTTANTSANELLKRPMSSQQQSTINGRFTDAINLSRAGRSSLNGRSSSNGDLNLPMRSDFAAAPPITPSTMHKQRSERPHYPPSVMQTRPSYNRRPSMDSTTSSMDSNFSNSSGKRSLLSRMGITSPRSKSKTRVPSSGGPSTPDVRHDQGQSSEQCTATVSSTSRRYTSGNADDKAEYGSQGQKSIRESTNANEYPPRVKPSMMRRIGSLTHIKNVFQA